MTVVTLFRGPKQTYNAMAVDPTTGRLEKDGPVYDCEHDKLNLAFGNTYFTGVGDAMIFDSVRALVAWMDPERPDLRRKDTFAAVLGGLDRMRRIRDAYGEPVSNEPSVALAVCAREDVFFWRARMDPETRRFVCPEGPTFLGDDEAYVLRGDTDTPVKGLKVNHQDPFSQLVEAMHQVNEHIEQMDERYKSPYTISRRCSGVMLPHKTSSGLRRQRPFDSLAEAIAKRQGGPAVPVALGDPEFMNMPMPGRR